jgi:hypothetical protein
MRPTVTRAQLLALSTLGVALVSCGDRGHDCLALPCPQPLALIINVTAGTGGPVNGAVVNVSGAVDATVPCTLTCYVPGDAGTYILDVQAPGFRSAHHPIHAGQALSGIEVA